MCKSLKRNLLEKTLCRLFFTFDCEIKEIHCQHCEWSTIQVVMTQIISKLDKHEACGWCENMSKVTPWIVRHKVQKINCINNKFWNWKSLLRTFLSKNVWTLFTSLENCKKQCESRDKQVCKQLNTIGNFVIDTFNMLMLNPTI